MLAFRSKPTEVAQTKPEETSVKPKESPTLKKTPTDPMPVSKKEKDPLPVAPKPREVEKGKDQPPAYASRWNATALPFDFVWFTPRANDDDPCAVFVH